MPVNKTLGAFLIRCSLEQAKQGVAAYSLYSHGQTYTEDVALQTVIDELITVNGREPMQFDARVTPEGILVSHGENGIAPESAALFAHACLKCFDSNQQINTQFVTVCDKPVPGGFEAIAFSISKFGIDSESPRAFFENMRRLHRQSLNEMPDKETAEPSPTDASPGPA